MAATTFSVDTPLYVTGLVARRGIAGNWEWWAFALSHLLLIYLFARLWRRAEVVTDAELTETRYGGKPAAVLRGTRAFLFAVPINCIAIGYVMLAMRKVMEAFDVLGTLPPWLPGDNSFNLAPWLSVQPGPARLCSQDCFRKLQPKKPSPSPSPWPTCRWAALNMLPTVMSPLSSCVRQKASGHSRWSVLIWVALCSGTKVNKNFTAPVTTATLTSLAK